MYITKESEKEYRKQICEEIKRRYNYPIIDNKDIEAFDYSKCDKLDYQRSIILGIREDLMSGIKYQDDKKHELENLTNTVQEKYKNGILLYKDATTNQIISYEEYEYRYFILYMKYSEIPHSIVLYKDIQSNANNYTIADLIQYYNNTKQQIDNE